MIRSPINDEFLKRFSDRSLVLDCPKIQLTQLGTGSPRIITGRGMLSLPIDGPFKLRMYSDAGAFDSFETLRALSARVQGEIIPKTEFYRLDAIDLSGFSWACEKLLININTNGETAVILGDFPLLTHRVSRAVDAEGAHRLSMYFFDELDVPWNRIVRELSSVGEKTLRDHLAPGIAVFGVAPYEFEVRKQPRAGEPCVLRVSSPMPFPAVMEARIEEALRFVTSSILSWSVVEKRDPDVLEVMIAPKRDASKGLFYEPLHNRPDCAGDYWKLFGAYLDHVKTHPDTTSFHPMSAQLSLVIGASSRLDVTGLLVSVAVEGVLGCEFEDLGTPPPELIKEIDLALVAIKAIKVTQSTIVRVTSAVGAIKAARARDKLLALASKGVISKQMVDDWIELRNSSAHASIKVDPETIGELLNQIYTVLTLLNLLVFIAIGYRGRYVDYSSKGWPIKDFEFEDDIRNAGAQPV